MAGFVKGWNATLGKWLGLQLDADNHLLVTLAKRIAGENLIDDLLRVESKYSFKHHAAGAGSTNLAQVLKTGSGVLHSVNLLTVPPAGGGGWYLVLHDGTTATGVYIGFIFFPEGMHPRTLTFNAAFTNGLYAETISIDANQNVNITYR